MSWGGCLTDFLGTGGLLTLSGRRASLGRRLLAAEDCRLTLTFCVAVADAFNGLPSADSLTTTGLAFALGGFPSTTTAPAGFGAVGWITVGRTGLGFWGGRDGAAGGVCTAAGCPFAGGLSLAAAPTPGDFGATGCTNVGRTSLGLRDGLASTGGVFTIARPVFALVAVLLREVLPGAG